MGLLLSIFHVVQAGLSAYSGLLSYTSIVKLQGYEKTSEQAAKYSSTAANQLHQTRTTQASGAIATICSLVSSLILVAMPSTNNWRDTILISSFNLVATGFAFKHVNSFWQAKAKVPLVTDFNSAINASNQMLTVLQALSVSWGVSCFIYGFQLA